MSFYTFLHLITEILMSVAPLGHDSTIPLSIIVVIFFCPCCFVSLVMQLQRLRLLPGLQRKMMVSGRLGKQRRRTSVTQLSPLWFARCRGDSVSSSCLTAVILSESLSSCANVDRLSYYCILSECTSLSVVIRFWKSLKI